MGDGKDAALASLLVFIVWAIEAWQVDSIGTDLARGVRQGRVQLPEEGILK
jgi:hypothetical protein